MDVETRARAVCDWLIGEARLLEDPDAVANGMVNRLIDAGVPIDRMTIAIPTLHAARRGLGRMWTSDGGLRWLDFPWNNRPDYEDSPFHVAHRTRQWVEFRLDEISDDAYGIVHDLRQGGFTHYLCIPVFFRDGEGGVTFATRRPEGFSADDLTVLRLVEPSLAMVIDLRRAWRLFDETLRMYVGDEPHARILSGEVQRGEVVPIRAAIMFTDMRGFTGLSAAMTAGETVELLNRYFDIVVPPIEQTGGQVLKYIGDGVLAIHRATDHGRICCSAALEAARLIVERMADDHADEPFRIKIAHHYGEVAYGNIGSGTRLDYTVVGPGVNIASRLADLCGQLERPALTTADFASMLPDRTFRDIGEHTLRGVPEPQRVFEPELLETPLASTG